MRRQHLQRGSVFGLDARVALLIFTLLTLVSGYTGIKAYSQIKAQGFASELRAIAKAAAQVQTDLGTASCNIACGALGCQEQAQYTRLFDSAATHTDCHSRWHGPYITPQAVPHPVYGTGAIYSYTATWGAACSSGSACYLWMHWDGVTLNLNTLEHVNNMLDGDEGGNEDTAGAFRWIDNGNDTFTVRYRMGRALGA